jgi:hypothetical protein
MENEEYNPEVPKYYNYKPKESGKLNLLFDSSIDIDINIFNNIYISAYDINNDGKYPFQRFLLTNDILDDSLVFPQINFLKNTNNIDIISFSKVILFGFLMLDDFEKFDEKLEFNGYFCHDGDLYLFYDITKCNVKLNDIEKHTNKIWLALLDEILNSKHLCNMRINKKVVNFFNSNDDFCFLLDENNDSYEIPIVSYVGKPENKLNFTYIFGEIARNKNSILGPFYYFTDYLNAFKEAVEFDNMKKSGIVRFALFIGNTKYFENYSNDNMDDSEIKSQRLEDETLNQNIEQLTMRITDHNGKWSQNYDSAYLGCIELDNGAFLDKTIIVLKEYNQQIPLSYHYINKNTYKNSYLII